MSKKLTTEQFIEKAICKHGWQYNYSKINYINSKEKVTIICHKHGTFVQVASAHMNGHGCSKCHGSFKKTTKQFVKEAVKVHSNKYDYSKTRYESVKIKVEIICKIHGIFK